MEFKLLCVSFFLQKILEEENAFDKFQERALGFCACCKPASGNHSCCDTFATMKSSFHFRTFWFVLYRHQNCLIVSSISKCYYLAPSPPWWCSTGCPSTSNSLNFAQFFLNSFSPNFPFLPQHNRAGLFLTLLFHSLYLCFCSSQVQFFQMFLFCNFNQAKKI